jgi:hypothetical protein
MAHRVGVDAGDRLEAEDELAGGFGLGPCPIGRRQGDQAVRGVDGLAGHKLQSVAGQIGPHLPFGGPEMFDVPEPVLL